MSAVPQVWDDVELTLILPAETEEWVDDALREWDEIGVNRDDASNALFVRHRISGNCNAITNARGFLSEIEDILEEVNVDPMLFELRATFIPRAAVVSAANETKETKGG